MVEPLRTGRVPEQAPMATQTRRSRGPRGAGMIRDRWKEGDGKPLPAAERCSPATRWEGRYSAEGRRRDGLFGRVQRSVYGATQAEALGKLRRAQAGEVVKGPAKRLPAAAFTVGSWLTTWLAEKEGEREYQTYRQYESVVRLHLIPTLGDEALPELTVADVKRVLDQKIRDGLSPKRVLHIRAVLRNALNDAMRLEYVERNVAHLARLPTVHAKSRREWNAEDIEAVLSKLEGTDLLAPVGFALLTGVRVGELLALRWSDMDHGREVHVQRSVYRRYDPLTKRGEYVYKSTKTAMADRRIPVNDDLAAILENHRGEEAAKRSRLGLAALTDQDLVFTTQFAEQINGTAFTHRLRKAASLTSHDLRHGFGSLLLGQGADVVVISRLLGHSNIQVTANVYLRSPRDQMREAEAKLHR